MKQRKLIAVLCSMMLILQIVFSTSVFAASLNTDKGQLNITTDDTYIYFSYEGAWSNYLGDRISISTDSDLGAFSQIVINNGNESESNTFAVYNAWSVPIDGASGSVTNSGKLEYYGYESMKWSFKVPISTYDSFDVSNMKLEWNGQSTTIKLKDSTPTTEEATSQETTTEEEKTESVTTEEATSEEVTSEEATSEEVTTEEITEEPSSSDIIVTGNIVIDGLYGDWTNLPKTEITYTSNNAACNHYGQLYTDGDTLYAHFKANDLYPSQMQIHLWYITINNQQFVLQIQPEKNGNIDWSAGGVPKSTGTHTNLKVFVGYGNDNECDSKVAYTIYDEKHPEGAPGDEIEFSISMKRLAELTGLRQDQMGTITIKNPNLGGEGVTIAGSSSGPYLIAIIGLLFAMVAIVLFRKKGSEAE